MESKGEPLATDSGWHDILSASVRLFTSGTETLAVSIFQLYSEGYLEAVCALAILPLVITLVMRGLARRLAGPSVWDLPACQAAA